jgi:glutaminyl-tRNA synthetase
LNKRAARVQAVINPLKVIIYNYPESQTEELDAINNPENPDAGSRKIPFSKVLYIERDDFMEEPPKKFFRLSPGREVRLRYAYFITCTNVVKNPSTGEILELHCTYDPQTRGGSAPDGRSPKATIHWVSAAHALDTEIRIYGQLFNKEDPGDAPEGNYLLNLNTESLKILKNCKIEPSLNNVTPGDRFQFERVGYFCVDNDSKPDAPVFNRTVTLKDEWARIQKREQGK